MLRNEGVEHDNINLNQDQPNHNLVEEEPLDAWFTAASQDDVATIRRMIAEGTDVNRLDQYGANALLYAAGRDSIQVIPVLIQHGININQQDEGGRTALMIASSNGLIGDPPTLSSFDLLLRHRADVNLADQHGNTALFHAIWYNNDLTHPAYDRKLEATLLMVQELLRHGASVDHQDQHHSTALNLVTYEFVRSENEGWIDVEKALLEYGADPQLITFDVLVSFFDEMGNAERPQLPTFYTYIGNLYDHGWVPTALDTENGDSLLIYFTKQNYERAIRELFRFGINPNIINHDGHTALYYAVSNGDEEIIRLLLQQQAVVTDDIHQLFQHRLLLNEVAELLRPHIPENVEQVPEEPDRLDEPWAGWTRDDISNFNIALLNRAAANDYVNCPICLKYVNRDSGCMYMHHNCKRLRGYYHQELYNKFKDDKNNINFCTICGRICSKGHSHYALAPPDAPKPELLPSSMFYEDDCRLHNNGGGIPEKIARMIGMREKARELNEHLGEMTNREALDRIVEAGWMAPLEEEKMAEANQTLERGKYQRPNTNFPAPVIPNEEEEKEDEAAPVVRGPPDDVVPAPGDIQWPILHFEGKDAIDVTTYVNTTKRPIENADLEVAIDRQQPPQIIQFAHRIEDGGEFIVHSPEEGISRESLTDFIRSHMGRFGEDPQAGYCPFNCGARLYPQEIMGLVPMDVYREYRRQFNQHFRRGGAYKTTRMRPPFYDEITDGACYVRPRSNRANQTKRHGNKKRIGKKNRWKTRRHPSAKKNHTRTKGITMSKKRTNKLHHTRKHKNN